MRISDWSSDVCSSDLGFRHGPKTFVTEHALVMVFVSNDPLTRRYDLDLVDELRRDGRAARIIEVSAQPRAAAGADGIAVPALADELGRASCSERVRQ